MELHIDLSATTDIVVHPSAYPPGTLLGDLIAIRPAAVIGKGKTKDRPLLYKVERLHENDEQPDAGMAANRRTKAAPVTVSQMVAQSFPWIKNRLEVVLTLVSRFVALQVVHREWEHDGRAWL